MSGIGGCTGIGVQGRGSTETSISMVDKGRGALRCPDTSRGDFSEKNKTNRVHVTCYFPCRSNPLGCNPLERQLVGTSTRMEK